MLDVKNYIVSSFVCLFVLTGCSTPPTTSQIPQQTSSVIDQFSCDVLWQKVDGILKDQQQCQSDADCVKVSRSHTCGVAIHVNTEQKLIESYVAAETCMQENEIMLPVTDCAYSVVRCENNVCVTKVE